MKFHIFGEFHFYVSSCTILLVSLQFEFSHCVITRIKLNIIF